MSELTARVDASLNRQTTHTGTDTMGVGIGDQRHPGGPGVDIYVKAIVRDERQHYFVQVNGKTAITVINEDDIPVIRHDVPN